jgi:serine/threonine protein kinase
MSESSASSSACPRCGAALPSTATAGLCPRCLMAEAMMPTQADAQPSAQPPLPPEQIAPHFPQLEILECLGRGGMGVVYKARQKTLNRFVALKLLAPERVRDPKFAERFTREAQALAALNHPNIVTIHDFGQAGGFYYLLMEFVDGLNLRQLLRTRKFTPEEALAIVPPLCDALQFAHDRGIVHRDIKPENVLLDKAGRVKVADFGIAKMLGPVNASGDARDSSAPDNATQAAVGTPGYSAPEQKSDPRRVDSRADIYSLGVVFYELLTGELPGKRIEPPSHKVQIDVRLDEVVLRALEKKPELRYQQVSEVKTMVETIVQSPEISPRLSPASVGPKTIPIREPSKTMKSTFPKTAIIVGAVLLLVAGAAALIFHDATTTVHIEGIPKDWSVLKGDTDQWNWTDNTITGHTTNGDSTLASTRQFGDVTLSAMVSTTNREASLALRFQDADNGYLVAFVPDGTPAARNDTSKISLLRRFAGEEKELALFIRRGLSAPGKLEKLTFSAIGSRLEVRLNDITIMKTNDSTFASGYIGLRVYGDPRYPCDAVFSNLTVSAKASELRGEAGAWRQEKAAAESPGAVNNAVAAPEPQNKPAAPATVAPPPGLVELKMKWPPGQCYVMDFDLKQNMALLLRGRAETVEEDITMGNQVSLTVLPELPDGGRELELEFLNARMGIKMGGGTILDYNSVNTSAADQTNGAAAVFGKIVGAKLRFFLNASNDIERLEGVGELVRGIESVPQTGPLTGDIKKIFGAAFFETFTNVSPFLPPRAVQPGDTWPTHSEHSVSNVGIEVLDNKVVFQNWEMHDNHHCARLELQGIMKVKPDPNSKRDETTYRPRDGVAQGVVWFDPELGQIIEADFKNDINVDKQPSVGPGEPLGAAEPGQIITTQRHQVYTIKLKR